MAKRVVSSIVGLLILIAPVVFGGGLLKAAVAIVTIIGMAELYRAFGPLKPMHFLGFGAAVIHMVFLSPYGFLPALPILLMGSSLIMLIARHKTHEPKDAAINLLGFFYIAATLSSIYLLRATDYGSFHVWLIFISAWGCDTGAYFCGRAFGRKKLAPALSPKKTLEGAIGGTIIAAALAGAYGYVLYSMGILYGHYILIYSAIALVCSIFGQLGDLAASAIKRHNNIKDFGSIMPGHGGVLDRFDSIIFTAPLAFAMIWLI